MRIGRLIIARVSAGCYTPPDDGWVVKKGWCIGYDRRRSKDYEPFVYSSQVDRWYGRSLAGALLNLLRNDRTEFSYLWP